MLKQLKVVEKIKEPEGDINPFVLVDSEIAIADKNMSRIAVIVENLKKNNEMLEAAKTKLEEEHLQIKAAHDETKARIAKNDATIAALEQVLEKEYKN